MTETEKLKARIEALGYSVIVIDLPYTYFSNSPEVTEKLLWNNVEVVIFNGSKDQSWDKDHTGHPCTDISYCHWKYGTPITFVKTRRHKTEKDGTRMEVEGCLDNFEECIKWYSLPPRKKPTGA